MYDWRHRLMLVAFALCVAVVAIFAMRAFHHRPHPKIDEPIKPWMSVPYVALSYHVPAPVLLEAVKLPATRPFDHRPIGRIARDENRPVSELIVDLQNAIKLEREQNGQPQPPVAPRSRGNPPEKP